MMTRKLPALTLLLALTFATFAPNGAAFDSAAPAHEFYLNTSQLHLEQILLPPPAPHSSADTADLKAVLEAQRTRTPAEVADAQADANLSVFRFADVMGSGFTPANLPFTTEFFKRFSDDALQPIESAKKYFGRPRPFITDPKVQPCVKKPNNESYPSGHATFAYVNAIVLACMVPEKAMAIFERAAVFAHNRVVGGVHYPSDVDAGRISAFVIDNVLISDPRFKADLRTSKAEVRKVLGLKATADHRGSAPCA
jgi:acid phosphatase (class A)